MTLTLKRIGNGGIEIIFRKTLKDRPVIQAFRHGLKLDIMLRKRFGQL